MADDKSVMMNISQIILIASDRSFTNGSYVLLSNNYVAILGVVFATIWTNKQNWNRHAVPNNDSLANSTFDPSQKKIVSTIRFDPAPYASSSDEIDLGRSIVTVAREKESKVDSGHMSHV